jgi:SAM-dependent methyltransferase
MPDQQMFRAPADAYDRFVGRYSPALASELIAFAGVESPMRALDVGAGPGALTAALAERVGAQNVAAVEPSDVFAQACRDRAPGVEVTVAGAQALPFPDGAFDATLSQLVVNFIPDPLAGVREMARVTRPGGTVASCVWDYGGEMRMLRAFWDAAREVDPSGGAAADEATVMRCCGEGDLGELWASAGITGVRSGELVVSAAYEDFDDLWSPFPAGVGPAGAYTKALDPEGQAALRDAFRARLGVGDGPFELTARAWAVAGSSPPGRSSMTSTRMAP